MYATCSSLQAPIYTYDYGVAYNVMIYGECYNPEAKRLRENIISLKINLNNE